MGSECETVGLVAEEERAVADEEEAVVRPTCECSARLKKVESCNTTLLIAIVVLFMVTAYAFGMTGLIISMEDYASHHYVHKTVKPLAKTLDQQQQQVNLLIEDMVARCIDAFLHDYMSTHPVIDLEPDNEYASAILEGVRIQAQVACTPAW